jgi:hypothetical protein
MRNTTLALAAAGAVLAAAAPASASDYTVTGGKLDWTMANAFTGFGDATRTWLGYVTFNQPGNPGASNGTATPTAPSTLTGPTGAPAASVDPNSPRGVDQLYTFGYPVAGGAYNDKGVGSVETKGTVTFTIHGSPITVVDPLVTLDGLTGTLRSSGVTTTQAGQTSTYDRSKAQFNLDLSNAEVKFRADGSRRIVGIVPSTTADTALVGFGANSNRFGTMTLTLALDASSAPQVGATGRDGINGTNGVNGKDGRDATLLVVRLKKAPFKTAAEVHVRLIDRATGKTIAQGTAERKTLRLGVLTGTTLKGTYLLKRTAKHASGNLQARVTIG